MAYCTNCGNEINGQKFCTKCGKKTEIISESVYCTNCGNEINGNSKFCERCGTNLASGKIKPKKSKLVGVTISVILVIALTCSTVFGYTLLSNPIVKLKSVTGNTLGAKSAEFKITADAGYKDSNVDGEIEIDTDKKYLCMHVVVDNESEVWFRYKDSTAELYSKENGGSVEEEDIPNDINNNLELLFDALNGNSDENAMEKIVKESEYNNYINTDELKKEGKKLIKELTSKENLKNILGYEKSKNGSETTYSFEPNLYKLIKFVLDKGGVLLKTDFYNQIKDEIKEMDSVNYPMVKISIFTKGKYLTGYKVETEEFNIDMKLSNINRTSVRFPGK